MRGGSGAETTNSDLHDLLWAGFSSKEGLLPVVVVKVAVLEAEQCAMLAHDMVHSLGCVAGAQEVAPREHLEALFCIVDDQLVSSTARLPARAGVLHAVLLRWRTRVVL